MFPKEDEEYTCTCGPGPYPDPEGFIGDVFGSAPYSSNSDVCRAALHAGVIGPEGGEVTAISVPPPEDEPRGSTAHGVTSLSMGSNHWDVAFTFEGAKPRRRCPTASRLGRPRSSPATALGTGHGARSGALTPTLSTATSVRRPTTPASSPTAAAATSE